jgi:hypothetical protein
MGLEQIHVHTKETLHGFISKPLKYGSPRFGLTNLGHTDTNVREGKRSREKRVSTMYHTTSLSSVQYCDPRETSNTRSLVSRDPSKPLSVSV